MRYYFNKLHWKLLKSLEIIEDQFIVISAVKNHLL